MSEVTIDTLAVEITSNSAGAAKGIDELAASLMKLKGTTISSTAVKNLTDLTGALRGLGSVTSEAQKIGNLADSIKKLSSVGSMNKVINQLNKLPGAVKGLSSITIDQSLTDKVNGLTNALQPLTTIKPGGLGTMVNALAKIGTVTKSLDDDTISKFTDRVKRLNDTLGPLSTKMTTVQAGLRGINSSAKSANTGMKQLDTGVRVTTFNLANAITVIRGLVSALMPLVRLFSQAIGSAMEWDGISYQFGNAFGEQADEYYDKITQITEALNINKQTFMENSAMAASMLKGFGVASSDAREMGLGYTELAYDIWAAYNNIYKTLDGADGAMAAVRSAIAGEVEPIRRAGFTIVESQLEMTAANYGIAYSSEKATEAQKSYLRYLTLVEQAHTKGIVGAYAHELTTAEGLTRTLTQQTKTLAQSFGSLFLPILVKVLPWLQAFVDLLTEAIVAVASFFGIEIQPATWGDAGFGGIVDGAESATGALGDTADAVDKTTDALKDLKKATIGIDELNVISPPSSSGSGSGGSGSGAGGAGGGLGAFEGLDVDSLWDEAIWDNVKSQVDEIKQKVKDFFDEWETEIKIIGGLLAALGMAKMLEHLGEALNLGDKFLGVVKNIAKLAVTGIIIVLQYTLMTEFFDKFIDGEGFKEYVKALFVGALGTAVLYSMWGTGGLIIGLGVIAAASLSAIIENGGINSVESAVVALTGFAAAVGAVVKAWPLMAPVIEGMKEYVAVVKQMSPEVGLINAMFPQLSGGLASFGTAVSGAWGTVAGFLGAISAPVWAAIAAAIVALIGTIVFLKENWDEVKAAAKRFFDENIGPKIDAIKESFKKMGEALGPVGDAIAEAWKWLTEFIAKIDLMDGVKAVFEGIGFVVVEILGGAVAGAFQFCVGVIEGFIQVITGIVEIVSGVVQAIYKLFTGDLTGAGEAVKLIGKGIADVFVGLYDMTIGAVVDFVEGIIDWCVYLWDELVGHSIIPDTIDGIVECFKSLPGKALKFVVNFVKDVINKFKEIKPVQIAVSLAKSGWKTISGWIGKIPTLSQLIKLGKSGWSSVKKWIGSIPAVSQAVKLAKSGWSTVKKWIGTMPTLSAGIKLVKSGWTTVKKWLGSLDFKLNFKLPKIGVNWGSKTFAGFKISYPTGFYTYAKGGFPDIGEMFIAREAGPEMVGKIGNKTTVANNQQIVEAVSEGVYSAVLAAMRASENNGSQSVNVYLDGRQITNAVEKRQHERGAALMGKEVFAY